MCYRLSVNKVLSLCNSFITRVSRRDVCFPAAATQAYRMSLYPYNIVRIHGSYHYQPRINHRITRGIISDAYMHVPTMVQTSHHGRLYLCPVLLLWVRWLFTLPIRTAPQTCRASDFDTESFYLSATAAVDSRVLNNPVKHVCREQSGYYNCDSTAIGLRRKMNMFIFFIASRGVVANKKAVSGAYNDVVVYVTVIRMAFTLTDQHWVASFDCRRWYSPFTHFWSKMSSGRLL